MKDMPDPFAAIGLLISQGWQEPSVPRQWREGGQIYHFAFREDGDVYEVEERMNYGLPDKQKVVSGAIRYWWLGGKRYRQGDGRISYAVSIEESVGWINQIVVEEELRSKGIGRRLVELVEARMSGYGATECMGLSGFRSAGFWQSLGYHMRITKSLKK